MVGTEVSFDADAGRFMSTGVVCMDVVDLTSFSFAVADL
jgi:hypothetical protein